MARVNKQFSIHLNFNYAFHAWYDIMQEAEDVATLAKACELYREFEEADELGMKELISVNSDKLMRLSDEVRQKHTSTLMVLRTQWETVVKYKIQESLDTDKTITQIEAITKLTKQIIRDDQHYRHRMSTTMAMRVALEVGLELIKAL